MKSLSQIWQATCSFLLLLFLFTSFTQGQSDTGSVVVRVNDTSGTHCIDANTEKVTLFLRRVFTEKNKNFFTEDNRAGVLVRAQLSATSQSSGDSNVQIPSVDLVSVRNDKKGRVSLALEYSIASGFVLTRGSNVTQTIDLYINLAKTKGKTSFGNVLDLAGQALQQISLPANPYLQAGSKFLKFANAAIDSSVKTDNAEEIAHIGMKFNQGPETNLDICESAGNERTGAIAVLRSVGATDVPLIPVTNTERLYCFSYSSNATYELLAAPRRADGTCPPPGQFHGVANDYVMLLISAQPAERGGTKAVPSETVKALQRESGDRCRNFGLPNKACGL